MTLEEIGLRSVSWQRNQHDCGSTSVGDWPRVAPDDVGLDGTALEALADRVSAGELGNLHSIVVVKDAALAFERYFTGADMRWGFSVGDVAFGPETLHDARSLTKSVVGVLMGIACGDGLIEDLDVPLLSFFPEYGARYESVLEKRTLRHALTMTAGLAWDETTHPYWDARNDENGLWRADDPLDYVFSRRPVAEPGVGFAYNGGLPTVLASVIEKVAGTSIELFARERLWCPLGVSATEWVQHRRSGLFVAASGLRMSARDLARFGQLMVSGGRFAESQILPQDYVDKSLSPQVSTGSPMSPDYGYQWWIGAHPMAIGNGGQRILIDRTRNMVVVVTAGNYDSQDQGRGPDVVLEAVLNATGRDRR